MVTNRLPSSAVLSFSCLTSLPMIAIIAVKVYGSRRRYCLSTVSKGSSNRRA